MCLFCSFSEMLQIKSHLPSVGRPLFLTWRRWGPQPFLRTTKEACLFLMLWVEGSCKRQGMSPVMCVLWRTLEPCKEPTGEGDTVFSLDGGWLSRASGVSWATRLNPPWSRVTPACWDCANRLLIPNTSHPWIGVLQMIFFPTFLHFLFFFPLNLSKPQYWQR